MEGGDVGHWVLEFLLRARYPVVSSNLLKKVLRIVPLSDFDSRLQKTLLLRTLQDHLFAVSVPESVLETLELLEELHRRDDGALITAAAMSAAYCAIAVDCTLKHLLVELHNNPAYLGAVNRIWRGRVRHMSGSREGSLLLSLELERWRTDIETSLLDSLVRERLASIDTTSMDRFGPFVSRASGVGANKQKCPSRELLRGFPTAGERSILLTCHDAKLF